MSKKKILFGSSSYLIPNNSSWENLNYRFDCLFTEMGDYKEIFSNHNDDKIICFVIFFEDIIQNNDFLKSKKLIQKRFNYIFELIENRLKSSSNPLIVTFSNEIEDNYIKLAKSKNYANNINLIIEKFEKIKIKYSNFYLLNFNNILLKIGTDNAYDYRNWYFAKCRLSSRGLDLLADTLHNIIERLYNPPSKVLVLDCDNTLWGGVIGEDGIKNISLGEDGLGTAFVDFQVLIKKLSIEGTIICLCSKNNEKDVWEVFEKHKNMILKKEDITIAKINWKNKADNILQISKELNLGLKSFVFWDDNPMERNIVKKNLPEVEVVEVDEDVSNWPKQFKQNYNFFKFVTTKDDLKKKKQYEIMSNFVKKKSQNFDEIKYLKSIKLKPKLCKIDTSNILRAEQLCFKTNQFNLRNIRYNQFDLSKLLKNKKYLINLMNLKDEFGDHGLTGLQIIKKLKEDVYLIDNLMLSCRVFGRYVENWMLYSIVKEAKKKGGKILIAEFRKTQKNIIALEFLKKNDFKLYDIKKDNLKIYENFKKNFQSKNIYIFELDVNKIKNLEIFKDIKL